MRCVPPPCKWLANRSHRWSWLLRQHVNVVKDAEPTARGRHPGKERQRRDADQTQAAIVAAAMTKFAAKGLTGPRVDAIAQLTSTSKHMIYYYFGSKEGLYRAALEHAYRAHSAWLKRPSTMTG